MYESKLCLALDGASIGRAIFLMGLLAPWVYAVKIHNLYDLIGHTMVRDLQRVGARRVWIDAKLHDTPDTVRLRVGALVQNGARIITVHASGGVSMMEAATAASVVGDARAEIWAITVLTSLDPMEITRVYGKDRTPQQTVLDLALMAKGAGVQGIVCSAQEVDRLSQHPGLRDMKFVVPGTRSAGVALGQQKRSGTPAQAVADGATLLVAGSQVTNAQDPVAAFKAMAEEIGVPIT